MRLQYTYDEKKGYSTCDHCGDLVLADEDDTWLGEDERGVGHAEVCYRCEGCGRCTVEVEVV
jgi:hypothetical protein